ncbi:LuxR C-terminal-related transcriptional regulator [Halomonas halocynthiae]|uniref:LuxR C-terminal-related transcriptional regulator n=1 Tax=Halomonas halocynthiae TaxID=176290 RepID=UPI00040D7FDF|nr:LuxR C-terminal-related transcriptional regulator [Halomonas halocynthiae]
MHTITQGRWQAKVNAERGGPGFTFNEANDMMLLAEGNTFKEIGRATQRSPETVKDSLGRAKHKLRVYRAAGAVAEALRRGWIAPLLLALLVTDLGNTTAARVRQPMRTRPTAGASARTARREVML